jgi:hypothetical protein
MLSVKLIVPPQLFPLQFFQLQPSPLPIFLPRLFVQPWPFPRLFPLQFFQLQPSLWQFSPLQLSPLLSSEPLPSPFWLFLQQVFKQQLPSPWLLFQPQLSIWQVSQDLL